MASISLADLALKSGGVSAAAPTVAPEAAEPKAPAFVHNSMRSYSDEYDELQFKLQDARSNVQQMTIHIKNLNDKLQSARELEEVACEDDSATGRSDLQKARQLIESCSKRVADLEARLAGWRRTLYGLEVQLKTFPQAEMQVERKRISLRQACR